ncbi:hypothetical protein AGOR_G00207500 [Albula goreensis]|uniref:TNFR-Cys domain-containing protein n=1 Tax=Albula goreensis TaxID=1534307 RepID=A0A8T3CTE7_9TELE|nr:hypothetical protein AGOR_G00207500 [Albula goreensis]
MMLQISLVVALTFCLLCVSTSLSCDNATDYQLHGKCCKKCKPGEHLVKRCTTSSPTQCSPCRTYQYSSQNNEEITCRPCSNCNMLHLVYKRNCTATHDAICDCAPGYRCKSEPCLACEEIPGKNITKIGSTSQTSSSSLGPCTSLVTDKATKLGDQQTGHVTHNNEPPSSVWFSLFVIVVCCCALLICVILASRHKNGVRWARQRAKVVFGAKKPTAPHQCTEEEGKMPVQEECEKLQVETSSNC